MVAFEPAADDTKLLNGTIPTTRWKTSRSGQRTCGRALFARDPVTGRTGSSITPPRVGGPVQVVETLAIDDQARFQLARDFIKIDVEGQEWAVLRRGRETLSRHHPIIFFEASEHLVGIRDFLADLGCRLFGMKILASVGHPAHNTLAIYPERHRLPPRL